MIAFRRERLASARLYLVCDERPDSFLEAALRGGVDIIQLRMKLRSEGEILVAARRYARVCKAHGALFILNDEPELAVEVGADGVHVGQEDMPAARARAAVGPERLVGLSTHSRAQLDAAAAAGVDYVGAGPVHETPTKAGRQAVGLALVRYAAAHSEVPFFAIGGIDETNVATVRAAGAERIAVVRALTSAADPEQTACRLRQAVAGERLRSEARLGAA